MSDVQAMCACGMPLHYASPDAQQEIQKLVDAKGETVVIQVFGSRRAYHVPRHYVALHGIAAIDLDALAIRYNWERARP